MSLEVTRLGGSNSGLRATMLDLPVGCFTIGTVKFDNHTHKSCYTMHAFYDMRVSSLLLGLIPSHFSHF